jgi:putative transposase
LNLPVRVVAGHDKPLQIMQLNLFGNIAQNQWHWLQKQYPYVVLHSFIVMPNHVHGILEIDSDLISDKNIKIKSVSELVGAYKTTSSKQIHLAGNTNFSWQRSFHDHIIRNDISYQRISNYIDTNAERWNADTFFENF